MRSIPALCAASLAVAASLAPCQTPGGQSPGPRLAPLGVSHPPQVIAPRLEVLGQPLLGSPLRLDIRGGQPGQFGLLAVGQPTNPVVIPGGHTIYAPAPLLVQPVTLNSDGERIRALNLAPLPSFALGVDLAFQGAFFDTTLPSGFATSQAIAYRLATGFAGDAYPYGERESPIADPSRARSFASKLVDLNNDSVLEEVTLSVAFSSTTPNFALTVQTYDGWAQNNPRIDLAPSVAALGLDPQDLTSGDVTGDGNADLVVTDRTTGGIVLLPGNGDLTFANPVTIPGLGTTDLCQALDFNGDGALDLAVTRLVISNTVELLLLLNDGSGTLGAPIVLESRVPAPGNMQGFTRLATGDFNGDGLDDILSAYYEGTDFVQGQYEFVLIEGIAGPPGNSTVQSVQVSGSVDRVLAEELSGDAFDDLAYTLRAPSVPNATDPVGWVLTGDCAGSLFAGNPQTLAAPASGRHTGRTLLSIPTGSVSPPGLAVLTRSSGPSEVLYYPNLASNGFGPPEVRLIPPADELIRLDPGDGRESLFALLGASNVATLAYSESGHLPQTPEVIPSVPNIAPFLAAVADFNGDGIRDLLSTGWTGGLGLLVHPGRATGGFDPGQLQSSLPPSIFNGATTGDFNGDGIADVAVSSFTGASTDLCTIFLGGAQGLSSPIPAPDLPAAALLPVRALCAGDVDQDGDIDLVAGGGFQLRTYLNDGTGTFTAQTARVTLTRISQLALADMDRDARLDAVALGESEVYVFPGFGGPTFGVPKIYPSLQPTRGRIEVADLNSDGWPDVLYNTLQVVVTRANDGAGGLLVPRAIPGLEGVIEPRCADLDGDGDLDLIGLRLQGRSTVVAYDIGLNQAGSIRSFHSPGRWQFDPMDVDFDGLVDLLSTGFGGIAVYPNQRGGRK